MNIQPYKASNGLNKAFIHDVYLQVAGVAMTVLKTSTIFEKKWLATQIDAAAACPTLEGNEHVWRTVDRAVATTEDV